MSRTSIPRAVLLLVVVLANSPLAHAQQRLTTAEEPAAGRDLQKPAREQPAATDSSQPATSADDAAVTGVATFPDRRLEWLVSAGLVALLITLGALALVLRLKALEGRIERALHLLNSRHERELGDREKGKREELPQSRKDLHAGIESLKSVIRSLEASTQKLSAAVSRSSSQESSSTRDAVSRDAASWHPSTIPSYETSDGRSAADVVQELLLIANRIVRLSSTSLDEFRATTDSLAVHVSTWPNGVEGIPAAFVAEHRGRCYAVPNVVKPARLPQDWFNRSDFGVNDEIRDVISLPRLRRSGNGYSVEEPGVFKR